MQSTLKKTLSSTPTHVSESLASDGSVSHVSASKSGGESLAKENLPGANEDVEKDLQVVEFVVEALFADKKRELTLAIERDIAAIPVEKRTKMLDCGCGCDAKPCKMRKELKTRQLQKIAHQIWPKLEKQLVKDLARTLCNTQRSQRWYAAELLKLGTENMILRQRLAVVASAF
jgi:hypothetical protein